jgi:hypothetical protein
VRVRWTRVAGPRAPVFHEFIQLHRTKRLGPALAVRDFRLWWLALLGMDISLQMLEVAIGWEVYTQHHNVLDLGWSRAFPDLAHVDRIQDIKPTPRDVLEGAGAPAGLQPDGGRA